MISYELDGSVILQSDTDLDRVQLIPAGRSRADVEAAIAAFFGPPPACPVPLKVTNYQARKALIDAGRFAEADAKVHASGDPATLAAWDYANEFFRASPFIAAIGGALNMTPAQIDDLFRAAEQVA